jgi:hypothetical protein
VEETTASSKIEGLLRAGSVLTGAITSTLELASTLYTESYLQSEETFAVSGVIDSASYTLYIKLQEGITSEIDIGKSALRTHTYLVTGVEEAVFVTQLGGQVRTDVQMRTEGTTLNLKGELVPVEDIVVMEQSVENIPLTPYTYSMNNYTMLVDFFGNNGIITECSLGSWDIGVYSGDPYRNTWQLEIVSATLLLEIETPLEDS